MDLLYENQTVDLHPTGTRSEKLQRTTIAALDEDTISVRAYDVHNQLLAYPIGAEVTYYIVRPDAIYSGTTEVVDKQVLPEPLLILKRNDGQLQRLQRRQYFRVSVRVKVAFTLLEKSMEEEQQLVEEVTQTRNLSAGGLLCAVQRRCKVGDPAQVDLYLPAGGEPIHALCRVARVQNGRSARGEMPLVGLEFEEIAEADRARLTRFLFRVQARMTGR